MREFIAFLIHTICVFISNQTEYTVDEVYEKLSKKYYMLEDNFLLYFQSLYAFFVESPLSSLCRMLHTHVTVIIGDRFTIDTEIWAFFVVIIVLLFLIKFIIKILIKILYYLILRVKSFILWLILWIAILKDQFKR